MHNIFTAQHFLLIFSCREKLRSSTKMKSSDHLLFTRQNIRKGERIPTLSANITTTKRMLNRFPKVSFQNSNCFPASPMLVNSMRRSYTEDITPPNRISRPPVPPSVNCGVFNNYGNILLLMNGHKSSVYQLPNTLFTNQSGVRNCYKITNCEQFRTKCCVKIAATLRLATTDVYLIRMCQKCYNRRESWVFVKTIVGKWV